MRKSREITRAQWLAMTTDQKLAWMNGRPAPAEATEERPEAEEKAERPSLRLVF